MPRLNVGNSTFWPPVHHDGPSIVEEALLEVIDVERRLPSAQQNRWHEFQRPQPFQATAHQLRDERWQLLPGRGGSFAVDDTRVQSVAWPLLRPEFQREGEET